mmetsp:Transcript_36569/g.61643  ORF Transcript_36569/g.61643 Transcript_36569/m.61643 type:complete len:227 (+) Transcript_36569:494-1174(+)
MDELAELLHLAHKAAVQQLLHPVGRTGVLLQRQLHLQNGVREAGDLRAGEIVVGVAAPAPLRESGRPVVRVLQHHGQVRVQADAHGGVEGDLEGGAHVLCAHHWLQLLGVDLLEDLGEEAPELGDGLCACPGLLGVGHGVLHRVVALQEGHHLLLREGEALLHAQLPGPAVLMGLALNEDSGDGARAVPAHADGDGVGLLVQAAVVELQRGVVKVGAVCQLGVSRQ